MSIDNNKSPSLLNLLFSFLKLGISAFGGPAIIHYIYKMAVDEKKWIDKETADNGVALSQTIPGIISMQMACYVGLQVRGIPGAFISFIGLGIPAFFIMLILTMIYSKLHDTVIILAAFHGLHAIVVSIIAAASVSFSKKLIKKLSDLPIIIISIILFTYHIHPIIVILVSSIIGIFIIKKDSVSIKKFESSPKEINHAKIILILLMLGIFIYFILYIFDKELFKLTTVMSKIVLLAFGGGYTSLPIMLHEVVDVQKWLNQAVFMDGIILGQITPGPFVITATFVGYMIYGLKGAICGTFGVFLPPFFLVVILSQFFNKLADSIIFNKAIKGILFSFVGLLIVVTFKFIVNMHWDFMLIVLSIAAFIALIKNIGLLTVVLTGTIFSVIYYLFIFQIK